MLCTRTGYSAGDYLSALSNVLLELFYFFVIYVFDFINAEMTNLRSALAAFAVKRILHLRLHLFLERYLYVFLTFGTSHFGEIERKLIFESRFVTQTSHIAARCHCIRHLGA